MKKISIALTLGALGFLFVFGWVVLAELEAADPSPEPTVAATDPSAGAQDQLVEPTDPRFPLPAPDKTGMVQADSSNCITCHTSQEDLQALAEEPEETESLSEGEG
jgi:hypothetical protein